MPSGICPECGSSSIVKEVIMGQKTGDYQCVSCGNADMPQAFKDAEDKKRQLESAKDTGFKDNMGKQIFADDIVQLGNSYFIVEMRNDVWILKEINKNNYCCLKTFDNNVKRIGPKYDHPHLML